LQQDPLLSDFQTIVIDEFHERSIHADLGLALARQAWLARPDLRIAVMSATLDTRRVAAFLGDCPIVEVPGRTFQVDVEYRPGEVLEDVLAAEISRAPGAVLAFLPGAPEIRRAAERLRARTPGDVAVLPLHGGLDADAQDAVLMPSDRPRLILATNIAETTLTVPDVRTVVDTGLHKVARYDAARGIDSLDTERISLDAAEQRAGRAGRVAAGRALRLWDARDRLRPHREPDIARIDLATVMVDLLAWGADPMTFEWFEAPAPDALASALELLQRLEAIDAARRLTDRGRKLHELPLHPRLGTLLLASGAAPEAARACAVLSERHFLPVSAGATGCDLLAAVEREQALPAHVLRVAHDVRTIAERALDVRGRAIDEETFRRAVLRAYPDRVAQRRAPGSDRLLLASGTGARLGRESGVVSPEFLVAVEVSATRGPRYAIGQDGAAAEAIVRIATGIDRAWLSPTASETSHVLDETSGVVRAVEVDRYGAIVLRQRPVPVDPVTRSRLLAVEAIRRGPDEAARALLARIGFAGLPLAFADLVERASTSASRLDELKVVAALSGDERRRLDRDAPTDVPLPSGRRARLTYTDDGRVLAAVKLQELFGLGDTPRVGPRRTPVTFELLSPSGRPVQVTSDLRSFWNTGYGEVRKQLRARYPRHPWPDDPWTAVATHRTKKST
jgi:ATP-dependent helicase HrpB